MDIKMITKLEIKFLQLECKIIFINLQKLTHEIVGPGSTHLSVQ